MKVNLGPYSAELGGAIALIAYWLLVSFIPVLEPFKETFMAVIVAVLGFIFSAQVQKGLIGKARAAIAVIPDYLVQIITAVVGVLISMLVVLIPDLVPLEGNIVQMVLAVVFFILELGFGIQKGFHLR